MYTGTLPSIIWSENLWTKFDEHKHLMNTKSIVTRWWSYTSKQGSVINFITWNCWPAYTYNMVKWGIWLCCCCRTTNLRRKRRIVSMFHVLINKQIRIDFWKNGDNHGKKLETKHMHNQHHLPEMSNDLRKKLESKHTHNQHRLPGMSNVWRSRHLKSWGECWRCQQ